MIRTERADARANRLRVLEAARQAFARQGLAAEIKDIAELAGVGVGTIYRSFGSKTDLLAAVAQHAADAIEDLLRATESEQDPVTALRDFLMAAAGFADAYGWLFQLFLSGRFPTEAQPITDQHKDFDQRLRLLLRRGVDSGAYRRDLPVHVAAVLVQGALISLLKPQPRQVAAALSAQELADGVIRLLSLDCRE